MIVRVAFLPSSVQSVDRSVFVVLDVLRASSTMLAMFEAGAADLFLAAGTDEAIAMAAADRSAHWICGERDGLRPEGFDFGNSPTEVADADLKGRRVIYATSNGTNALRAVARAPLVLVASPRNALAAARLATREATARDCDLTVVCAGDEGGRGISLEDAFCAGLLVERLLRPGHRLVAPEEERGGEDALALDDSAILAHRLYRSYLRPSIDGSAHVDLLADVFVECRNGRDLPRKGFAADLEYCAQVDVTTVVPRLELRGEMLAVVAGL